MRRREWSLRDHLALIKWNMSAEQFRQKAASCHLTAEALIDPGQRLKLLELADNFLRLANGIERLEQTLGCTANSRATPIVDAEP
jgi:hypothetical protein